MGGRKAVEAFVAGLDKEDVLPFLARAVPVKKDFDAGVKLAEMRVVAEGLIESRIWKDDDGTEHRIGDWVSPEGVIHVWRGSMGEPEIGDPAGLYSALDLLDVERAVLDATLQKVWKIDFANLNRLVAMGARLARSGDAATAKRGATIVQTIKDFRGRKPDGPPHLSEKE